MNIKNLIPLLPACLLLILPVTAFAGYDGLEREQHIWAQFLPVLYGLEIIGLIATLIYVIRNNKIASIIATIASLLLFILISYLSVGFVRFALFGTYLLFPLFSLTLIVIRKLKDRSIAFSYYSALMTICFVAYNILRQSLFGLKRDVHFLDSFLMILSMLATCIICFVYTHALIKKDFNLGKILFRVSAVLVLALSLNFLFMVFLETNAGAKAESVAYMMLLFGLIFLGQLFSYLLIANFTALVTFFVVKGKGKNGDY